jgi:anti-anti-sigma factor
VTSADGARSGGARSDGARSDGARSRLQITITRGGSIITVALDGELDAHTVADARAGMDEALGRASAHDLASLVVDADALTFCDSTGLSVLVRASEAANAHGMSLRLRALSPPMRELLRITGLDALAEPVDG